MTSEPSNRNRTATVLVVIGLFFSFAGFVFPGLFWAFNTPGDVEMISLIFMSGIGLLGLVLVLAGLLGFIVKRSDRAK